MEKTYTVTQVFKKLAWSTFTFFFLIKSFKINRLSKIRTKHCEDRDATPNDRTLALQNMWLRELESLHLIWIYNSFVKTNFLTPPSLLTQDNSVLSVDDVVDLVVLGIGLWASVLAVKDLSSWMMGSKSLQALKYMKEISPPSL